MKHCSCDFVSGREGIERITKNGDTNKEAKERKKKKKIGNSLFLNRKFEKE